MKNALILAGGRSLRMGADKTLLPFAGFASLTHFLFSRLTPFFDNVFVSTKGQKFADLPTLADEFEFFAPLGVISRLDEWFKDEVFVVCADMPLVGKESILRLFSAFEGAQKSGICVAKSGENVHNLCGFYSPKTAIAARELLSQKVYKVGALRKKCDFLEVDFSCEEEFLNVNCPSDFARLEEFYKGRKC